MASVMHRGLTLTTGFWRPEELRRGSVRSREVYLHLFEQLLRVLPFPLVVFVAPEDEDAVRRVALRHDHPIDVRPRHLEDLPFVRERDRYAGLEPPRNVIAVKDNLVFSMMTWAKVEVTAEVAEEDPFGTARFGWVDFGLTHVADLGNLVDWSEVEEESLRSERVRVCERMATASFEAEDPAYFYAYNCARVCGGLLTGTKTSLRTLAALVREEVGRMADAGHFVLEEQILASLTSKYPDTFDRWYADYFGILSNVSFVRRDVTRVLENLDHCRTYEVWESGRKVLRALLDSMILDRLRLEPHECVRLLDAGIASASRTDPDLAMHLAVTGATLEAESSTMRTVLRASPDRNRTFRESLRNLDARPERWEAFAARDDAHAWSSCL